MTATRRGDDHGSVRRTALALAVLGLAACSEGSYDVVLRFDPTSLGADAERAEVAFVDSCEAQVLGAPAVSGDVIHVRRMESPEPLGDFEPGRYGLYARAFGGDCAVVAAGCETVQLEEGGEGELVVVLRATAGPACPAGAACVAGECVAADAARPDASMDATVPANDAGDDAGEVVLDAGSTDGGLDGGMDAGSDAGADAGTTCGSCDDSNPCTRDECTSGTCVSTPDDTLTCGGGVCHGGACCRGCWDGSTCQAGGAVSACGAAGAMCTSCDDGNPCTDDVCTLSGCVSTPNDSRTCTGGTCHGGACCTGCWDGAACRAGTAPTACGASGAACAACACPTNACSAGACAPADAAGSIGSGDDHVCVAGSSGRLYCWGENEVGQLGNGAIGLGTEQLSPVRIGTASDWTAVGGGENHTHGLRGAGSLWAWGDNPGVLMQGDFTDRQLPTRVGTETNWARIEEGEDHACVFNSAGEVWCAGDNSFGQLGLGDTSTRTVLTRLPGTWSDIAAGFNHTCGVRAGELWCWGNNLSGQLGNGSSDMLPHPDPIRVGTDTDWADAGAGEDFACAIKTDASLWCWGLNQDGQLGLGAADTVPHTAPERVGTASWDAIEGGEDHACGLRSGQLWCWGENDHGQVGIGSGTSDIVVPTRVGTASDWTILALGQDHSCAGRSDGSVWCWGINAVGQLGIGSRTSALVPMRVCFPLP